MNYIKYYMLIDAIILIYLIRVKITYILKRLYKIIYVNNLHINLWNSIIFYK